MNPTTRSQPIWMVRLIANSWTRDVHLWSECCFSSVMSHASVTTNAQPGSKHQQGALDSRIVSCKTLRSRLNQTAALLGPIHHIANFSIFSLHQDVLDYIHRNVLDINCSTIVTFSNFHDLFQILAQPEIHKIIRHF